MAGGRPTSYKQEYCEQARQLCLLKATNDKLAEFFCVAKSSIGLWLKKHKEFSDAVKAGREVADMKVVQALADRACGCSVPEDKVLVVKGKVKIVKGRKHYPPDTAAAFIWLKNRRPENGEIKEK